MTTVDPSSLYLSSQPAREPNPTMDKDGFLKVLMTQLQNQDPTQPMESKEIVDQLTSLSSLEQVMNMTESIDTLVQSQLMSPVIQYSHMIGKNVSYEQFDEETGEATGVETAEVTAVSQQDGWAVLELENGEKIYAEAILQVTSQDEDHENGAS